MSYRTGLILKDISHEEVQIGQVLATINLIITSKKFDANVSALITEEGGSFKPFYDQYKLKFYFRTTDITGTVDLPDNIQMVSPGDNVSFTVILISSVAMEVGTFIRDGE